MRPRTPHGDAPDHPMVPREFDHRPPARSADSGVGIRRWPRSVTVVLSLLVLPCVLTPIISRWRARSRLEAGDVCGPQSVVLGDPLAVAREELEDGATARGRTTAAYALRVCRPVDAPLTAEELRILKKAATSDQDVNVRVAATDTLLSVAGGEPIGEPCLRQLHGDASPLDPSLHGTSERVSSLRDVCAHHHTGACTAAHYVECVLLRRQSAPGPSR